MNNLRVAKSLKLPDLILSLLLLLKLTIGYKTFFSLINMMICNFVTFKFWATLELFRHHGNHRPKCFDCGIDFIINDWKH